MIYIGMDMSSKEFFIHAIDQRQQKIFEGRIAPSRAGLRKLVKDFGVGPKLFVFEAGNQMKWIALMLMRQEGVRIHVVHPNEVKWISQSSGKTDQVDARKLARLLARKGIEAKPPVFRPLHRYLGMDPKRFPAAEEIARRVLSIPLYPSLRLSDQRRVIQGILTP